MIKSFASQGENSSLGHVQVPQYCQHPSSHLQFCTQLYISLTDAWNFSDASLQSALGMKDGNLYETMMAWTRQLPINAKAREDEGVHREGWEGKVKL